MSLINKMNVGNTNYDIQDRLMPDAIGQAGQVLRVKDDASGLEFSDTEAGSEKVSLTFPAGASKGTITDEQLAKLQASENNYIEMVNDKELYYLNDSGHEEGFLTYSHVGIENSKATIKTLTITVSAKSFVIVTTVVPTKSDGGKLYQHYVKMNYNGQHTAIIFKSSRPISYSLLDLIEYIQTFPEHNFTAKLLIGDNWYAFPYDTYITADSSSITMWYANKNIGYGSDFEDTINANEIISDTVTEL